MQLRSFLKIEANRAKEGRGTIEEQKPKDGGKILKTEKKNSISYSSRNQSRTQKYKKWHFKTSAEVMHDW